MTDLADQLADQLAELVFQEQHRTDGIGITEADVRRAWQRYRHACDAYLDAKLDAEGKTIVAPRSEAETRAWQLLGGLLIEDDQESIAAMSRVMTKLATGDDVTAVVLALLKSLMVELGVDHTHPDYGHVAVGEDDYAGLAELHDGGDLIDVLVAVLRIWMRHVIGDQHDMWRSRVRAELNRS